MIMIRAAIFAIASLAFATSALAHHGAGTFELNKTVSFPGAKFTKIEFLNPHGWLYFEWTDASGKLGKYRCEMRSAHVLRRSGWSNELFKSGERVDITASPDRADPNSCYLQTILFANGARMDRYGQYVRAPAGGVKEVRGPIRAANTNRPARRPSGEPNISGEWAPEQVVMADPRGVGGGLVPLGRIGQIDPAAPRAGGGGGGGRGRGRGDATGPRLYGGTELTELGTKEAASFSAQKDQPRFRCETTSIIFDWTFDGPVNRITQNRDNIVIEYGQLNLKRTVHMNMKEHPANIRPSRAGHSIGRWEGDVLVVDTVGFLPGFITTPVRHGDKLHVVERFTLDPKTFRLTRQYEAEDPIYLKGKYTGQDVIQLGDAPYAEDKCKEQQFVDYSKQQSAR
jgi:hypothetical protein